MCALPCGRYPCRLRWRPRGPGPVLPPPPLEVPGRELLATSLTFHTSTSTSAKPRGSGSAVKRRLLTLLLLLLRVAGAPL